jgi:hypothetical protein
MRVALVERELIAGECAYWARIPSKTLVRPTGLRAEAGRAAGVGKPSLSFAKVTADRDEMIRHLDGTAQVEGYRARGIAVHRGTATALGPGRIQVGGEVVQAGRIVVATGQRVVRPADEGLAGCLATGWAGPSAPRRRRSPSTYAGTTSRRPLTAGYRPPRARDGRSRAGSQGRVPTATPPGALYPAGRTAA